MLIQAEMLFPDEMVPAGLLLVSTPADTIESALRADSFSFSLIRDTGRPLNYALVPDWVLFQDLVAQWHEERGATSSITEMAMCRAYLRIIAMKPDATPLIFRQMEQEGDEPDMWFVALQMLTGADPVTEEARGDFKAMADLWLDWGRAHGYAW